MSGNLPKSKNAVKIAANLRKNMTKEERHLWYDFLKTYPVQFRRQYVVLDYVIDFFCPKARLAIEIDGSYHYERAQKSKDEKRTFYIERYGIKVIRYTNIDVTQRFRSVCEDIDREVKKRI